MVELKFEEEGHKYTLGDKTLISVTQLVGSLFKPFDTEGLANKLAGMGWAKRQGKDVQYWLDDWKDKAEYGTLVHNQIESFINGETFSEELDIRTEQAQKYIQEHWASNKLDSEYRVYDKKTLLAGTIDVIAYNDDGTVTLIDWKTNKEITTKPYDKDDYGIVECTSHLFNCKVNVYYLQLLTYAYILEKNYDMEVKELQLVHLQDGKYVIYKYPIDRELMSSIISYRLEQVEE